MNLPPRTIQKLASDHPEGTRHQAKLEIALELLGNGIPQNAVFQTLREKFPNASAGEINGVVNWCAAKNPQPTQYRNGTNGVAQTAKLEPAKAIDRLLGDDRMAMQEWIDCSPVTIPDDPADHAAALISNLYREGEFLCGLAKFGQGENKRVFPVGAGYVKTREVWLKRIAEKGMVSSDAGCWWRMNPVKEIGSGKDGAPCDADVTRFQFALVEHDKIEIELQLSLIAKFVACGLSLAALIVTGGKSVHAWVNLDATDADDYAVKIGRLLDITQPLGFDHNRNPSRLARICGVKRTHGATGEGWQRLLYLNPKAKPFEWARFESEAVPILNVIQARELNGRVGEWMRPRECAFTIGLLRGTTPENGMYFRESEVTLWSGVTGHGKSSLLRQVMFELLLVEVPFFVASLEHKPEDICEGLTRALTRRTPVLEDVEIMLRDRGHLISFLDIVGEVPSVELFTAMRACHRRYACRHFFVDSLMRISNLEEDYPAQSAFLNELQAFAKETKGHVHLVTHPRKIDETQRVRKYDVKGSANIPNNADNIITVRRNVQKQEADENGKSVTGMHDAEVSVEKQRATGWQGLTRLRFDTDSRTFSRFAKFETVPSKRDWHNEPE